MSVVKRVLSVFGKIGIIIAIVIAFLFGMAATVFLSLRSSEVKVPDVVGKDRIAAETLLSDAGLNMRVRATRPSANAKPDTVLFQLPAAGEVVKVGQTVAIDVTRMAQAGESAPSTNYQKPAEGNQQENQNGNESASANQNENQNKEKRNKNANNKNANNSNNANNANNSNNKNANNKNTNNANNKNANNGNTNANRNTNANNKNANSGNNSNANKRAPVISTPPFNPNTTPGAPR